MDAAEPAYLSPIELQFSPDGRRLYVVCEGNDSVLAVDARTGQVAAQAKVGHKPKGIALSPNGKTLYVSNEWSDTISEIDATSFQIQRTLKAGWGPVGLATDRTGKFLYVANSIGSNISLLELATRPRGQALGHGAIPWPCDALSGRAPGVRLERPAAPARLTTSRRSPS